MRDYLHTFSLCFEFWKNYRATEPFPGIGFQTTNERRSPDDLPRSEVKQSNPISAHYRPDRGKHKRSFHGAPNRGLVWTWSCRRRFVFCFRASTSELATDFFNSILGFTRWSTSISGRCPGKALDAWNVRPAAAAGKHPALACGPQREIFGKARRAVLKFCVARSKARSFESMLVPCVNSPFICAGGGLTRTLMSEQFVSRRVIYASTNATKVIPATTLSLDKSTSNFLSSSL